VRGIFPAFELSGKGIMSESFAKPPSRWRPVVRLLIAFVLIDLVVLGFRGTWERHSPDDYAERVTGCAAEPREFVIIGGSPVAEGFNPEVVAGFEWKGQRLQNGYAVGLSGATTSDNYIGAIHACPTPPKVLVYGITASDLNDARKEPHGPYSLMTPHDWVEWASGRPRSAEWVTRHFLQGKLSKAWALRRYRHGIRMWAATALEGEFPGTCPDAALEANEQLRYSKLLRTNRGYAPTLGFVKGRYDVAKAKGIKPAPFQFLDRYRTGEHLQYLHKLADWAERSGIDLILVDMPITADLDARYAEAFAEYRKRLGEFEAARGVRVLRATREVLGFSDVDFADVIHLNEVGASKLSQWLHDRLSEAGGGSRP